MTSFEELNLHATTLSAIQRMGYSDATPVQAAAIPPLLEGRDVLAQARTGTGKTAAFGIPLIEGAAGDGDPHVLALVLVPTRELALQVTEELRRIAEGTHVHLLPLYGGVGFDAQLKGLGRRVPTVVVATPGRLMDHMQRGNIVLDNVRMLVLDEADRMLDMGFLPDVERIVRALPRQRQTALFSATVPEPIRRLSQRFLHEPVALRADPSAEPSPVTEQYRVDVSGDRKGTALQAILHEQQPERAIVFTRTKHRARSLAKTLDRHGWASVALQGNMTQGQRERALSAFRTGQARILVATDVASRGLDVPEVSHVINFDLPDEPEAYVHRIGRTARMGRSGRAFTFVQPDQNRDVAQIERNAGVRMQSVRLDWSMEAPRGPDEPIRMPDGGDGRPQRGGGGPRSNFRGHQRGGGGPRRGRNRARASA